MKTQKNQRIKLKPYTKKDFTADLRRRKRTTVIGVDFQKIENAPRTDLEIEVQQKIAMAPAASELLIREEEKDALIKLLETDVLPESEKNCVRLTLEGLRPIDIALRLNIDEVTVYGYLKRAVVKMKKRLFRQDR